YELSVIENTGFESYFLLVREFANFTRGQGIQFGVRGSAAGSLVSFTLGITDVNPVDFDLTFERFLNPERVSMPDIDMDFEDARRDEVIRWVIDRYGADRVAQIVTFGTLGPKAAIKDAGRVMGYSPSETDKVTKLIPNGPGWTITRALEEVHEFRTTVGNDPRTKTLVDSARMIEGLARHAGVHAAGVVISKDPLAESVPLYRSSDGLPVTGYEMGVLEKLGLLKMDFLGLSNLTVLSRTFANIANSSRSLGPKTVEDIPPDDSKTYDMLARGETVGVFQLESGGMQRNIIELKPVNVRELAAMVALYRPGPMEHIPRYIDNKFGRKVIEYLDDRMKPILEETFGVIVYQDQVLKVVQALAGFSLGKADILRKAMGKKDKDVMDSMKSEFINGCQAHSVDSAAAEKVWELLLPFAGYAFNKAHAVCYAILAYQTAYLKANYTVEYMAALLAVYRDKEDRVTNFIEECRRQGIAVLPPDVNRSDIEFSIESVSVLAKDAPPKSAIRFGLAAIKGVGENLVRKLIEERKSKPFSHLYEFAERLRPVGLNKTAMEALVKSGALDSLHENRAMCLDNFEGALAFGDLSLKERLAGQETLFGDAGAETKLNYPTLPQAEALDRSYTLAMEKEVMGVYLSDHPLRGYERVLIQNVSHSCSAVSELEDGATVKLAGVVSHVREITTRSKGERMATITVEDFSGQASCTLFPATYAKFRGLVQKDSVVRLRGNVSFRERPGSGGDKQCEVLVEEMAYLPAPDPVTTQDDSVRGSVCIRINRASKQELARFNGLVQSNPGDYEVIVQFAEDTKAPPIVLLHRVDPTESFVRSVEKTLSDAKIDIIERMSPVLSHWEEPAAAVGR
ncbi:MAG: DNA polymerase III subunit alpha, partial [Chthonomonadaceae bacterium]|nr:DNA polymerase III subunit alpha [Chthonomonadaceae bacterium]